MNPESRWGVREGQRLWAACAWEAPEGQEGLSYEVTLNRGVPKVDAS